jgi:branched-chain amino acid transport system permease protein
MESIFNLQQLVNGLQVGSIYALIALGYTMVYGIVRLINFAHGDFFMVGAYAAYGAFYLFNAWLGSNMIALAPIMMVSAMGVAALLAIAANKLAYKPLRYKPKLSSLITAIGVSMLIEYTFSAIPFIGPSYQSFPEIVPSGGEGAIRLFGVGLTPIFLIDTCVAVALMLSLTFLVKFTRIGKAMRAVSLDKDAAKLMGVNVEVVIMVTFLIGGAFAGAAGLLSGMTYPRIFPYMGINQGLKAFIAAVLGGIGNIPGAMLGAYIMGLSETFASAFNSLLGEGIAFVILILVLLFRPQGLLGEKTADKI